MEIKVKTKGHGDIINIMPEVKKALKEEGIKEGILLVFVKSTTSSIIICEDEKGIKKDLLSEMEEIVPEGANYEHNRTLGDGNAHSHLKAEFLGCFQVVPVKDGELDLGTWQNIMLVDWDNKPREREIVIKRI